MKWFHKKKWFKKDAGWLKAYARTGRVNVGPFLMHQHRPRGEFRKDWDTDANMIWLIGDWIVCYYGTDCTSEIIDPDVGKSECTSSPT